TGLSRAGSEYPGGSGQCARPAFRIRGSPVSRVIIHYRAESMAKEEAIEMNGTVEEVLRNATFRVLLSNGHYVLATMAGKMRRFRIRVLAGDRVTRAVSPYDVT